MNVIIEISMGEAFDRLSILKIKLLWIHDHDKLELVREEWSKLFDMISEHLVKSEVSSLYHELYNVNVELWKVEESLRSYELDKHFKEEFVNLARQVYKLNDRRSRIKNQINKLFGSKMEVKSHETC